MAGHTAPPPPAPAPDRRAGPGGRAGQSPRRRWLTWRRLPVVLELVTLGAAYGAPSLVRIVLSTARAAAFGHAALLYRAEAGLGLNIEPGLNHLVAPHAAAALAVGYYYGLLHFILTPLTLAWLYLCRPRAFPGLRSALVLSTIGANIVFWTWPVAPPRFAVRGLTDILTSHDILGSADPHGVTGAANLYAAMPSLHICWASWCAVAVVAATRSRWRHLAWLYPGATTFVVLATANHFLLDVAGGLAVTALGLAAGRIRTFRVRRPQLVPAAPAVAPDPAQPAPVAASSRATAILASLGAAALGGAYLSGAAFGALAGVPVSAGAQAPAGAATGPTAVSRVARGTITRR